MSSLSTLPKGDSAWLLRKAIERIMEQVSVLETNIGSSTTGNSANTQIIFNDNGTLRGDAGLVYNKTTDALTVTGLVTAGSATITGAATVGTTLGVTGVSTLASAVVTGALTSGTTTLVAHAAGYTGKVGIGTATPTAVLTVNGEISVTDNFALRLGSTQAGGATLLYNGSGNLDITPRSGFHTKFVDGNLIIGTSGKGIDFSAVTGGTGTATANVLNDYEEGTWTPTVTSSIGTLTLATVNSANYTKIGRVVTINFDITITTVGTGAGYLKVTTPFSMQGAQTCGVGRELSNTGVMCQAFRFDATTLYITSYNDSTIIALNNRVAFSYIFTV